MDRDAPLALDIGLQRRRSILRDGLAESASDRGDRLAGPEEDVEAMKTKIELAVASVAMLLAVFTGCGGSHPSHHQVADSPEARQVEAEAFARLSIEGGSRERALDDGAQLGEAYSLETLKIELGRELTEAERETVRGIMREALAGILTPEVWSETLVAVCTEHFTAGELRELNEFFQGPTGAKFLRLESQLGDAVNDRTDAVFKEHIDAFSEQVDERLGQAFPELATEEGL